MHTPLINVDNVMCRLFTLGYSFYAPSEAVLYHLYSRAHRPTFQEVQPADREQLKRQSQQMVRELLGMSDDVGCGQNSVPITELQSGLNRKYGLGE